MVRFPKVFKCEMITNMYGNKAKKIFKKLKQEGIIGAEGEISFDLLDVEVSVSDKSAVGTLLQEWIGQWMTVNKIYHRSHKNSQMPPDFFLSKSDEIGLLEIKTFDYAKSPNFDVANFDAYVRDLKDKSFRLDADYLIFGYTLNNGVIKLNNIWLKKVWEITCPSKGYTLKTQVKQGKIYNIRPYNFKSVSQGFQPFKDRLSFVTAIRETLAKHTNDRIKADEWFKDVKKSYKEFSGVSL